MSIKQAMVVDAKTGRSFVTKDPRATEPVGIDWTLWAAQEGVTAQTSTWTCDTGISVNSNTLVGNIAQAMVTGGVSGITYNLRNTVNFSNGVTDSRSIDVRVLDR